MALDKDGTVWVGTNDGLALFYSTSKIFKDGANYDASRILVPRNDGSNQADYLLSGESVLSISVDEANNLWVGTKNGVFHISCEGSTTWYEFAKTIFRLAGFHDIALEPCSSTDIPRPAKRPHNTVLSKEKVKSLGLPKLPPWQEALAQFIHQEWH